MHSPKVAGHLYDYTTGTYLETSLSNMLGQIRQDLVFLFISLTVESQPIGLSLREGQH